MPNEFYWIIADYKAQFKPILAKNRNYSLSVKVMLANAALTELMLSNEQSFRDIGLDLE